MSIVFEKRGEKCKTTNKEFNHRAHRAHRENIFLIDSK
jgi:hypothetical protein